MDSTSAKPRSRAKLSTFRKHRKIWISLFLLLLLILILLIIGLTLFKPKHAITTVNAVKLDGMNVALDVPRMRVDLNVSLDVDLTVTNPNRVSFRYGNSSTFLYYREILVGEATFPAGKISSLGTAGMNATLVVLADQLLADSRVYSDVVAGTLPLKTSTRISGRVTVMKFFKHHVVSYTYCDLWIDVWNRTVGKLDCSYKTKL